MVLHSLWILVQEPTWMPVPRQLAAGMQTAGFLDRVAELHSKKYDQMKLEGVGRQLLEWEV